MNRSDIKIDEITAMSKRLSDLIILIDIKENRWMELEEKNTIKVV